MRGGNACGILDCRRRHRSSRSRGIQRISLGGDRAVVACRVGHLELDRTGPGAQGRAVPGDGRAGNLGRHVGPTGSAVNRAIELVGPAQSSRQRGVDGLARRLGDVIGGGRAGIGRNAGDGNGLGRSKIIHRGVGAVRGGLGITGVVSSGH